MATQESNDHEVVNNTSVTVRDTLRGPGSGDARANWGTVSAEIASRTSGGTRTFRMTNYNGATPPEDTTATLENLREYAGDMIAHWQRVLAQLEAIAAALASAEGSDE